MSSFDRNECARALGLLFQSGDVVELRALNTAKRTVSGYFDNSGELLNAAAAWSGKAAGVYVTLNPVNPDLLARACNRAIPYADKTTADSEIIRRRWLPVDFDPKRPSGISSSDEEHGLALESAKRTMAWLSERGWPAPLVADSGNGAHLLYRIDLPADDASRFLMERTLKALASQFNTEHVDVDEKVFNAARIWKLYGTLACKGDSTPKRPHRLAKLESAPEALICVSLEQLQALADEFAPPAAVPSPSRPAPRHYSGEAFELEAWIRRHALDVDGPRDAADGAMKWVFRSCPWNPEHKKKAWILQRTNGAIAAGCVSASCEGHNWHELREMFDGPRQPKPNHEHYDRPAARQPTPRPGVSEPLPAAPTPEATGGADSSIPQQPPSGSTREEPAADRWGMEHFRFSRSTLQKEFALIYGTDEVWDGVNHRIVKNSDLREAIGKDLHKEWQPTRQIIRGVMFEPRRELDPAQYRNLYTGFPIQPLSAPEPELWDKCALIMAHIWFLVGGEEVAEGSPEHARVVEEFNWLLRWIALPLQKPGTKMASSVVMHGAEGTGKSYLWNLVKRLYGKYAITVGQAQLESQFTSWKSHKLLALCEEVVSRLEQAHHKGKLKHLVTGDTHIINEKMLREREEPNLMNFVFLSNEMQPLQLDFGDRRYYVRRIHKVKPKEYFQALAEQVENGGLEAFFGYLLQLSMDGFNEHTKPPENDDKRDLIAISMQSPGAFHMAWQAGEVEDLPYQPCTAGDLYRVYQRWCGTRGEHCKSERVFSGELKRFLNQARHDIRYPTIMVERKTQRIWIPREFEARRAELGTQYVAEVEAQCLQFLGAVKRSFGFADEREAA